MLLPLQASATRRYLQDRNGDPVWINGDTCWSLCAGATLAQAQAYIDDRVGRGFNASIWSLIERRFTSHTPAWRNANGDLPFDVNNNLTSPNSAYFAYAESMISYAASRGMIVWLDPCYFGFTGANPVDGWRDRMEAAGTSGCYTYGAYVGERLKGYKNIVWIVGGDSDPGTDLPLAEALIAGIQSGVRDAICTAHTSSASGPRQQYGADSWLAIDNTYTWNNPIYQDYLGDYNQGRATGLIEGQYELGPTAPTRQFLRAQSLWGTTCGCSFSFWGNGDGAGTTGIWSYAPDASSFYNSLACQDAARLLAFMQPLRWNDCVPDTGHTFVTGGLGTDGALDRLTADRTPDGNLGKIFIPTNRAITIDRTKMSGTFRGRLWDPTTGLFSAVAGSPWTNVGTLSITPPATNAAGAPDWMLVLETLNA